MTAVNIVVDRARIVASNLERLSQSADRRAAPTAARTVEEAAVLIRALAHVVQAAQMLRVGERHVADARELLDSSFNRLGDIEW